MNDRDTLHETVRFLRTSFEQSYSRFFTSASRLSDVWASVKSLDEDHNPSTFTDEPSKIDPRVLKALSVRPNALLEMALIRSGTSAASLNAHYDRMRGIRQDHWSLIGRQRDLRRSLQNQTDEIEACIVQIGQIELSLQTLENMLDEYDRQVRELPANEVRPWSEIAHACRAELAIILYHMDYYRVFVA